MKRKLNLKLCGCLVGTTLLLGTGVHFLHGYQVKRNAGTLLEQGLAAQKQQRLTEAVKLLSFYLAYRPLDTNARATLGLILEQEAKTPRERLDAFVFLEQVLQRDPDRHDVRRRLVAIAMDPYIQRYADGALHLETLLETFPDEGKLEQLLGECL